MPLLKKVMDVNGSIAVILPKQWTDALERLYGIKLKEILMEVNEEIHIKPYFPPKEQAKKEEPIELMPEIEEVG